MMLNLPEVKVATVRVPWTSKTARICYKVECSECSDLDWSHGMCFHEYAADNGREQHIGMHEMFIWLISLLGAPDVIEEVLA